MSGSSRPKWSAIAVRFVIVAPKRTGVGTNPGSIAFGSERIRVRVPRVRNLETGKEQPLKTYTALHKKQRRDAEKISMSVLLGLSQRKYKQVVRQFTSSFGLSASTVLA